MHIIVVTHRRACGCCKPDTWLYGPYATEDAARDALELVEEEFEQQKDTRFDEPYVYAVKELQVFVSKVPAKGAGH